MTKVLNNYLADFGYNLVALPKEDLAPLQLLYESDGDVSAVGNSLQDLFKVGDTAPPIVTKGKTVTSINGSANVLFNSEAGVNMLDWLLTKLKMGKLSGKLDVEASDRLQISFQNITEDSVPLLNLDGYISGSEPDVDRFRTFRQKLMDGEIYVVTSVLKSNAFSVVIEDENGVKADIEASVKGMVNANVSLSRNNNNAITLKNDSATPVAFAFKAQRILYNKHSWWHLFNKKEAGFHLRDQQGLVLRDESEIPTVHLLKEEELVEI